MPLALIFFLVLASGYFSLMETALNEGRHGRLEKLVQDGDKNAIAAMKFLESPTKALSTAQIGITVTGIFAGLTSIPLSKIIFAQINFFEQAEIVSLILALAIVAFTMLLFGGFLPKRTAQHSPEKFLLNHHRSIKFIVALMTPLVYLFEKISGGVMILLDMNPKTTDAVTEDEVKDLIEQGTEDGTFEKFEREAVDKIFHLSDETAYALMTPRIHMRWLDISDDLERNLKIIRETNQQIFPVGEGSLDEFRGVIYTKDLLDAVLNLPPNEKINLSALLKKPVFVTRTMDIFRIVERFKSSGESAAIVNDEYGGVIGLVTLDDIAGEIVGTKDIEQPRERQILHKDDVYLVDGLCDIDDFKRLFNFETLPNEEHEYFQTMGGFLTSLFGYIPKVGETYDWNGLRFEVLKMDRARVEKIRIKEIKNESHKKN
ncbi:MAG: HlyC/CorC family transporter [Selenomonadaceae bacterium]|nr:HlyC/CorC family transporter [Selenomonadaceae bacterium]